MRPEAVPLLVVALLLIAAQPGVGTITTIVDGDRSFDGDADAVVVAGGAVSIPEGRTVATSVYVIEGTAVVNGTLDGRLVQLSGTVTAGESAEITGEYQVLGGDRTIASGATVQPAVVAEPLTQQRSPVESLVFFVGQTIALAVVAYILGRRYSALLDNLDHSIRHHPLVSGTVGLLAIVTLLALFVFMAFTIILIPVSLLGLLVGAMTFLYAFVALGHVVGRRLPIQRRGVGTAFGTIVLVVTVRVIGWVPVIGDLVVIAALVTGVGAVIITYFGLREFQPPTLGPVE